MAGMTPGARRSARVSSLDGKEKSMRKRLLAATAMLLSTTAGAAGRQVMTIVLKYLRENRDKLHWAAWSLALNALIAVFPCEKADSGPLRSAAHY